MEHTSSQAKRGPGRPRKEEEDAHEVVAKPAESDAQDAQIVTRFKCYMCELEHQQVGDIYYRPYCANCSVKMEKMEKRS